MGQRTNSNVLRANIQNREFFSKYFEKKPEEHTLYTFQKLKIQSFINQFLNKRGLLLHDLKIKYTEKSLVIYVSFIVSKRIIHIVKKKYIKHKIKVVKNKTEKNFLVLKKRNRTAEKEIRKKNVTRKKLSRILKLIKKTEIILLEKFKKEIRKYKIKMKEVKKSRNYKVKKRSLLIRLYETYLNKKNNLNKSDFCKHFFVNEMLETISLFTKKRFNLQLILKDIKAKEVVKINNKREKKKLKDKIFSLRRYKKNVFFNEAVHIFFIAITVPNSAFLLTNFITRHLGKTQRPNSFISFLKIMVKKFGNLKISRIKGIKILIKGRVSRGPRSKKRVIRYNDCPIQTLKSKISHSESTSYTKKGTLGAKVWIYEELQNNVITT